MGYIVLKNTPTGNKIISFQTKEERKAIFKDVTKNKYPYKEFKDDEIVLAQEWGQTTTIENFKLERQEKTLNYNVLDLLTGKKNNQTTNSDNITNDLNTTTEIQNEQVVSNSNNEEWICTCGHSNTSKFCSYCGSAKPETQYENISIEEVNTKTVEETNINNEEWICSCGRSNTSKFCSYCGNTKPELQLKNGTIEEGITNTSPIINNNEWTCSCGHSNTSKFCSYCGNPQPTTQVEDKIVEQSTSSEEWVCTCGHSNTSKFCSYCGSTKPEPKSENISIEEANNETAVEDAVINNNEWTCSCGHTNTSKFCSYCGKQKDIVENIKVDNNSEINNSSSEGNDSINEPLNEDNIDNGDSISDIFKDENFDTIVKEENTETNNIKETQNKTEEVKAADFDDNALKSDEATKKIVERFNSVASINNSKIEKNILYLFKQYFDLGYNGIILHTNLRNIYICLTNIYYKNVFSDLEYETDGKLDYKKVVNYYSSNQPNIKFLEKCEIQLFNDLIYINKAFENQPLLNNIGTNEQPLIEMDYNLKDVTIPYSSIDSITGWKITDFENKVLDNIIIKRKDIINTLDEFILGIDENTIII